MFLRTVRCVCVLRCLGVSTSHFPSAKAGGAESGERSEVWAVGLAVRVGLYAIRLKIERQRVP